MSKNLLVTYDELPKNLDDYNLIVHYDFNNHEIKLYSKGSLIFNIDDSTESETPEIEESFGGTDNWGKDQYELTVNYTKDSVDYDSVYVDTITIQEFAGDNNWCKCELINNNKTVKYTALSDNNSSEPRIAYFYHSTNDDTLKYGSNVGKKVKNTWCVTVIQEGNPIEETAEHDAQINGDEIFNQLLLAFNTTLYDDTSKYISKTNKSTVYNYLLDMFNLADIEWNKKANSDKSLFNKELYFEAVNYRSSSIVGNIQTYEAMQSWLIAMCLAELIPTSGDLTNNQTELFNCAYRFGDHDLYKVDSTDNNANIIKENCYGIKQDATIARYVAAMIYAFNHDTKVDTINKCREEFNSNCITIPSFNIDSNPDGLGCESYGYKFKSLTSIGYFINGDKIFGEAPGPFTTTSGYKSLNRKPSGQNPELFYGNNDTENWYDFNYKMDVAIDKYVRENYNFYCDDTHKENDRTQANIDAFNKQSKDVRQLVLESGIIPGCYDFMWHGKKRMKFTGIDRVPFHFKPANNSGYIYMHKFELADDTTTNGDNIYEYVAPYYIDSLPNLWYNNPLASNKLNLNSEEIQGPQSHEMKFMCRIRSIADDNRNFSYAQEYGRRRPLGDLEAGWTRNEQKQDSPLNGINKHYAAALCCDSLTTYNNIMKKFKNGVDDTGGMLADDFPHDRPASWPSGHASQTWTPALYLCQMIGNNPSLQKQKMEIIKKSYKIGSLRSVGRFHWNSDILYGRLYATMLLPIINATQNLRDEYNRLKSKLCNGVIIPELKNYGNIGGDTVDNQTISDITFTLRINNNSGSTVYLNGEFYMFLDTIEDGKLTSDNTGKYGYIGEGLILEGGTASNVNSIVIKNGNHRDFNITIPIEILNRLSNNLSPQSRCYGHQGNIILYTYGRWPNSNMSDGWQKGHISDFYEHGFIDNNSNGFKLINGSTHTLTITGVKATSAQLL